MLCGSTTIMRKYTPEQATATFWSRVDKSGGEDACWLWTANNNGTGYGIMRWRGKNQVASRISYELAHGSIPDGLCVLHACDNRACVNPLHLWVGTYKDNMQDMIKKGRQNNVRSSICEGEKNPHAKLTTQQVIEIRRKYRIGDVSQRALGDEYGVSDTTICEIIKRQKWKCI